MESITKGIAERLSDKDKNILFVILYALSLIFIIAAPLISTVLVIATLGLFAVSLVSLPRIYSYSLLFGLFPFANIFKLSPGTTSLFTVCEILLGVVIILDAILNYKTTKCSVTTLLAAMGLLVYLMLFSTKLEYLNMIKLLVRILVISFYFKSSIAIKGGITAVKRTGYALSVSMLLMMLLSSIEPYMEVVTPYLRIVQYDPTKGELIRSGGLLDDPNYCSLAIMATLTFMTVLYYYKHIKLEYWVFVVPLFLFGFSTYSKSYLLMAAVFLIALLLLVLFPKHRGWALVLCVAIVIAVVAIFSGKIEVINRIFDRFESAGIFTGRDELNNIYMTYIYNNTDVLLFGEGFDAISLPGVSNAVHNLYIELLFKLGVAGSVILTIAIFSCFPKTKTKFKIVNYLPAMFIAVMYMALAGLHSYELFYYILLAGIAIWHIGSAKNHEIN